MSKDLVLDVMLRLGQFRLQDWMCPRSAMLPRSLITVVSHQKEEESDRYFKAAIFQSLLIETEDPNWPDIQVLSADSAEEKD